MSFVSLGLTPQVLKSVIKIGYKAPYPIQEKAIPVILEGKDMLGIAKTGSGKTASYVLPILSKLQMESNLNNRAVPVLVLVPTRELAVQVAEVFKTFSIDLTERIKTLAVFGGVSINPQMIALQGVHVLVATTGRLIDLVESNAVSLSQVSTLVIDEADKMLNLGFQEEMTKIIGMLPSRRQNLLFSATLSKNIEEIKGILLNNPAVVNVEPEIEEIDEVKIEQYAYYNVLPKQKGPLLRYIIKTNSFSQILVFTSSVYQTKHVAEKLQSNGINARALHGKLTTNERTKVLRLFKDGAFQVLVATDLLSRGIDINNLPCVVNYELPRSPKDYVHRIGRTGRADATGVAYSLITEEDEHHFKIIKKKMGKEKTVTLMDCTKVDLQGY